MLPATRNAFPLAATWNGPANRIENFFDRFLGDDGWTLPSAVPSVAPVSMWQDDDHYFVEVELPGVAEADIDVTVHNELLSIRCEKKAEDGRNYLYNARAFGRIERQIRLPGPIDSSAVEASTSNGILRLALPKSAESKPKKITVRLA